MSWWQFLCYSSVFGCLLYIYIIYINIYNFKCKAQNILDVNICHTDRHYITIYYAFYRHKKEHKKEFMSLQLGFYMLLRLVTTTVDNITKSQRIRSLSLYLVVFPLSFDFLLLMTRASLKVWCLW